MRRSDFPSLTPAEWAALTATDPYVDTRPPAVVSPDCREANHHKCYGSAFDEQADRITACDCYCHNDPAEAEASAA